MAEQIGVIWLATIKELAWVFFKALAGFFALVKENRDIELGERRQEDAQRRKNTEAKSRAKRAAADTRRDDPRGLRNDGFRRD